MAITTVLLDLDGVIRHFDPAHVASVEQHHGLRPGALATAAFGADLVGRVITGKMTRVAWVEEVGELVGNPAAADEWLARPGRVDWDLVGVVDELRRSGTTVAVLTNGTDTIPQELWHLGIGEQFDAVFNTADIGFAKPDRRAFQHVCAQLEVDAPQVFFTDDSASNLAGAVEIGMTARVYEGVARFRQHLDELLEPDRPGMPAAT